MSKTKLWDVSGLTFKIIFSNPLILHVTINYSQKELSWFIQGHTTINGTERMITQVSWLLATLYYTSSYTTPYNTTKHCPMLHCATLPYPTLLDPTLYYTAWGCIIPQSTTLQHITSYTTLYYITPHTTMLLCTILLYNTPQYTVHYTKLHNTIF